MGRLDEIASHLVGDVLRDDPGAVRPVVRRWAEADHLWLRRTAVLSQLGHRERTDTGSLAVVIEVNLEGSRHGSEFFVRKAIGWALRDYARADPDWVRAFLGTHQDRLSPLSRREAAKHLDAG